MTRTTKRLFPIAGTTLPIRGHQVSSPTLPFLIDITNPKMDSNADIAFEFLPFLRVFKNGRFERPLVIPDVPAGHDPATGVTSKDVVIDRKTGVSVRLYLPSLSGHEKKKLPVLVYIHGGGFFSGSAGSPWYHSYINSLVSKAKVLAVSVDYRIAPEHLLPAAYDDSWAALEWVASHSDGPGAEEWLTTYANFNRVFLAGDSAGSNIVHNMAMRSPGMMIEGLALVHPYFWGTNRLESEMVEDGKTFLTLAAVDVQWPYLCPGTSGNDDPLINPLADGAPSLAGLGCNRVLVAVAEGDLLRDRGRAYCEGLKKSGWGGKVELFETEGEDHGFHFPKFNSEKAFALMDCVVAFLNGE